jgi:hypothetical protein
MSGPNLTRRDLLAATAVAGLAAVPSKSDGKAINDGKAALARRRHEAQVLRSELAREHGRRPLRNHPTNGDEENLVGKDGQPNYLGNYSKGLKHRDFGEPDPESYRSLLAALKSGDPDDFERIILGGGLVGDDLSAPAYVDISFPPCKGEVVAPQDTQSNYRRHAERQVTRLKVNGQEKSQALLVNPQAGLGFDLEGGDSHALVMRVPPSFTGKEIIAEIAENYWMALARDVPLVEFNAATANQTLLDAAADLSKYDDYKGPRDASGKVTPAVLFRGRTPGDLAGDYVSQFLLRSVPFGAYQFPQKLAFSYAKAPGQAHPPDFLTDEDEFLRVQDGNDPDSPPGFDSTAHYISFGRDLADFVHIDELFQAYFLASLILGTPPTRGGLGAPHDEGNPYDGYRYNTATGKHQRRNSTQQGFGTLGEPNVKGLVTEVGTRALKAVWYQKWLVHRRLRPEEFAGRIHFQESGKRNYPFHAHEYKKLKDVLKRIKVHNNNKSWLLPMAFPEGCPIHPAYGAGHATVAGACVTVLKALFHEEITFHDLQACVYRPSRDGSKPTMLMPGDKGYDDLAKQLTVGGELNKLASNISLGRNIAGVHWRSDHEESLKLGEAVALQVLRDTVPTYNERVSFRVTRFDGTQVVISNNK